MVTIADYPHLKFSNIEHFNKALEVATSLGSEALKSFQDAFAHLERMCNNDEGEVHSDCAEDSFYFRIYQNDSCVLDGGIIKHGAGSTHTVELCPKQGVYWAIHT